MGGIVSAIRSWFHSPPPPNPTVNLIEENARREKERQEREERERQERQEWERQERERLERERREWERQERERLEGERQKWGIQERERQDRERQEWERQQRERQESERQEWERQQRERQERERQERERQERERQERERQERERQERERQQRDAELHKQINDARKQAEDAQNQANQAQNQANEAQQQTRHALEHAKLAQEQAKEAEEQAKKKQAENAQLKEENATKNKAIENERTKRQEAEERLSKGIRPIIWPSLDELQNAKQRLQYKEDHFHFAVAGISGTGKSSLINAIRGLRNNDPGASKTGIVETTSEIERYPDPDSDPKSPRSWFVWYDVPGAGTLDIPDWQYFNEQGLFIFDFIIIAYDNRFTATDIAIIKNCDRFNIPSFIVRAKADAHINNIMNDEDVSVDEARKRLIERTRLNVESNLKKADLDAAKKVYIISNRTLFACVTGKKTPMDPIDELSLVEDLMRSARRRYGTDKKKGSK